jgi:peptidoglycan biosynthesis protein MviN/MurJ (putative lipid II flippase)
MSSVHDKLILRGFTISFVFLLIAKIGGALKEVVLANAYGTSPIIDAYSLGFTLANWPVTICAVTVNALLIPVFAIKKRGAKGESDGVTLLVIGVGILGVALAALIYLGLSFGAFVFNLNQVTGDELAEQAIGMALLVPPGLMAAVLAARLLAAGRQVSALFEVIPALIICISIITMRQHLAPSTLLAWATALGMVGYFIALLAVDPSAMQPIYIRDVGRGLPRLLASRGIFIVLLAQIVFSLGGILIDQLAAVGLSQGDNAALSYSNRLLMLATGLGATAIGRAVMPVLSTAEADGLSENLLQRWVVGLFVGGAAVLLIGWMLAPFAVSVLFQRGEFTAEDTNDVAALLKLGLLQLPFYFPSLILAQAIIVRRRFGLLFVINTFGVSVKFIFLWLFLDDWGASALMYGTLAMYVVTCVSLGFVYVQMGKTV